LKLDERVLSAVPVKDAKRGSQGGILPPQAYDLGETVAVEVCDANRVYTGFRIAAVHLPQNAGT